MELSITQMRAIRLMREAGLDFIAGSAERAWAAGQSYYIDSRVKTTAAVRKAFKTANAQAKGGK